jgi:hypothetical protein
MATLELKSIRPRRLYHIERETDFASQSKIIALKGQIQGMTNMNGSITAIHISQASDDVVSKGISVSRQN